jgi:2-dehydropantoate 2-reductase
MKIVILGAGGIGSVLGAHLVRAGEEVIFIARGQRAAFIQDQGIILTGRANFTVPVRVITNPLEVQEADVLMVTVKAYDMAPALASLRHVRTQSALGFQNGLLKNEQLARTFGWEYVLGATAGVGGEVRPDGTVRFTTHTGLFLGEFPTGTSARVHALVDTLTRAGIRATASPQMQTVEWSKYVLFVSTMVPAVLTRLASYQFFKDPDEALIIAQLMHETALIAAKLGIPLDDDGMLPIKTLCRVSLDEAVSILQRFGAAMEVDAPAKKVSALDDLERGRRFEVEETLGYAVRKGAELGISLPTMVTCYRLIAGINRSLQGRVEGRGIS